MNFCFVSAVACVDGQSPDSSYTVLGKYHELRVVYDNPYPLQDAPKIGEGGYGAVYRVTPKNSDEVVSHLIFVDRLISNNAPSLLSNFTQTAERVGELV